MSITQATIDETKRLNLSEKILIVEEIWDSVTKDNMYPELSETQRAELENRIESYHANPIQGRTWEDIKNEYWNTKKL